MLEHVSYEEKEEAIRCLIDAIAECVFRDVYNWMQKEGSNWCVPLHHGFGTSILVSTHGSLVRNQIKLGCKNEGRNLITLLLQ